MGKPLRAVKDPFRLALPKYPQRQSDAAVSYALPTSAKTLATCQRLEIPQAVNEIHETGK